MGGRLVMCSVFDVRVGAYTSPFCVRSRAEAIRSFTDACADDSLPFKKHPSDYALYVVGEFDDDTGVVSAVGPVSLINGDDVVVHDTVLKVVK
jgi:hypothetical protein